MPKNVKELSEEWKKNISKSHLGKHIGEKNNMWNKSQSEYQKKRASETHKGKKVSVESKKKMSKFHLGKKYSRQTKEKMRIAAIEYIEETRGRISPNIGHNEKQILDRLEQELNYKIIRQFKVEGYFVDGYIPELNFVIEVDESFHNKQKEKDIKRQKIIGKKLECEFIRINDEMFK